MGRLLLFLGLMLTFSGQVFAGHIHVYERGDKDAGFFLESMKQNVGQPKGSGDSEGFSIIVDESLPFEAGDIVEGWEAGNNTTVDGVTLKDGRKFNCQWVVFDDPCPVEAQVEKAKDSAAGRLPVLMPAQPKTSDEKLKDLMDRIEKLEKKNP